MTISFQTNSDGHKYFVAKDNNQIKQFREMFGYSLQDVHARLEIQDGKINPGDIVFIETKEVRDKIDSRKTLEEENKQLKEDKTNLEKENEEPVVSEGNVVGALTGAGAGALLVAACASNPVGWVVGGAAAVGAGIGWLIGELF